MYLKSHKTWLAAHKVTTRSLFVPQLKSTCLHSRLTRWTNDPTSYSLWSNVIGCRNKQKPKKSLADGLTNLFWFYAVSSNQDAFLKCDGVKVSIFFGKCSKVKVYRNRNSKVRISKKNPKKLKYSNKVFLLRYYTTLREIFVHLYGPFWG